MRLVRFSSDGVRWLQVSRRWFVRCRLRCCWCHVFAAHIEDDGGADFWVYYTPIWIAGDPSWH